MAPGEVSQAAKIIHRGGIVAYPTEYCFGLGCDPFNRNAVLRLLRIKCRPASKGLILIAAGIDQLGPYVDNIPQHVLETWPGPFTWLLNPRQGVPYWLTGDHPRIAVRITAHALSAALCRTANMALVSTSANRSRQRPARSVREVQRRFGKEIDYVLPGFVGGLSAPTPIRDAVTGEVVRPG